MQDQCKVCGLGVHCFVDDVLLAAGQASGFECTERLNQVDHAAECRICQ